MDFVETEGENIDDAIENALKLLGVGRDKITVDIVAEGRKGILGFGAQKARIRAQLRTRPLGQQSEPEPARNEPVDFSPEAAALVQKAETALRETLRLMGVQATIEIKTSGDETTFQIHADNSGLLIGRKGQTLEALQYLVTRIAGEHYAGEGPHIVLDVEKYRERRRKMLEGMALRLGEKAKRQRRTVTVDALSAADRRIIHAALQDDPWVSTKSLGQGSYRRLLIIPEGDRKKKDQAASPQLQKQPERAQSKTEGEPISADEEDSQ